MQVLNATDFESFIADNSKAVIHFDAAWNVDGLIAIQHKMEEAESLVVGSVAFAYVDCDKNPELAKAIPILNVPTVAYYSHAKLVAALIGAQQNVRLHLERLLQGEPVAYKDGADF